MSLRRGQQGKFRMRVLRMLCSQIPKGLV